MTNRRALGTAFAVFFVWTGITLGGAVLQVGEETPIGELAASGPMYGVMAGAVFILVAVAGLGWWREVGLLPADGPVLSRVIVLPAVVVATVMGVGLTSGVETGVVLILLLNTVFVGFSEELALRGVLLHGFSTRWSPVRSVVLVAVLFGLVHALNGFVTGNFLLSSGQAVVATFSGLWLGLLRIRLASIVPVMILHALWDFGVLLIGAAARAGTMAPALALIPFALLPVVFVWAIVLLWRQSRAAPPIR